MVPQKNTTTKFYKFFKKQTSAGDYLITSDSERNESITKQRKALDCAIETICSNSQGGIFPHHTAERY